MFESGIETTIIITAIVLWFAHGWYLNERLKHVHKKLDHVLESLDGLRDYLYEIDPQFDDERGSRQAFEIGDSMFAGINDMELISTKEQAGKRTLNTPWVRRASPIHPSTRTGLQWASSASSQPAMPDVRRQ